MRILAVLAFLLLPLAAMAQTPPNQNNPNITVTTHQMFSAYGTNTPAANLFTATDTTGTITSYRFWNTGPGVYIISGSPVAAGTTLTITPSQLSSVVYRAGNGTDQLQIAAGDVNGWSDYGAPNGWAPFDVLVQSPGGYQVINSAGELFPSGQNNILNIGTQEVPGILCQGNAPEPVDWQYFTNNLKDANGNPITMLINRLDEVPGLPSALPTPGGQFEIGAIIYPANGGPHYTLFVNSMDNYSGTTPFGPLTTAWSHNISPPVPLHPGDTLAFISNCFNGPQFYFATAWEVFFSY